MTEAERGYIHSGVSIEKIREACDQIPPGEKNVFLRGLSRILTNFKYETGMALNPVEISETAKNLLPEGSQPLAVNDLMKFIIAFFQNTETGKQEVLAAIDSMIDPDISDVPDTVTDDLFK